MYPGGELSSLLFTPRSHRIISEFSLRTVSHCAWSIRTCFVSITASGPVNQHTHKARVGWLSHFHTHSIMMGTYWLRSSQWLLINTLLLRLLRVFSLSLHLLPYGSTVLHRAPHLFWEMPPCHYFLIKICTTRGKGSVPSLSVVTFCSGRVKNYSHACPLCWLLCSLCVTPFSEQKTLIRHFRIGRSNQTDQGAALLDLLQLSLRKNQLTFNKNIETAVWFLGFVGRAELSQQISDGSWWNYINGSQRKDPTDWLRLAPPWGSLAWLSVICSDMQDEFPQYLIWIIMSLSERNTAVIPQCYLNLKIGAKCWKNQKYGKMELKMSVLWVF